MPKNAENFPFNERIKDYIVSGLSLSTFAFRAATISRNRVLTSKKMPNIAAAFLVLALSTMVYSGTIVVWQGCKPMPKDSAGWSMGPAVPANPKDIPLAVRTLKFLLVSRNFDFWRNTPTGFDDADVRHS